MPRSRCPGADLRFAADAPDARVSVAIEGFTLLFHRPSGITHILATPAPEMIDALAEGPADAGEIVERLAARHGIEDPDEAEAVVAARLAELEAAGLVRRL
jgi:PqqD family protein of HPr-rel-A system